MREFSVEGIVGVDLPEEKKAEFLSTMGHETFETAKSLEIPGEIPKTPDQIMLCKIVNQAVSLVVKKYGGNDLDVTPDHIRISDDPSVHYEASGARVHLDKQLIVLKTTPNDLDFTYKATHELMHFKSYGAMQVPRKKQKSVNMYYRIGLRTVNENREVRGETITLFNALEEAVNEKLTKEIVEALKGLVPQFAEVIQKTKRKVALGNVEPELLSDLIYLDTSGEGLRYTYVKNRQALETLVDKLYAKNTSAFKDKEEVFQLFARAKFTGKMVSLGRLVDTTFGAGTFKKIGEAFTGEELMAVVDGL